MLLEGLCEMAAVLESYLIGGIRHSDIAMTQQVVGCFETAVQ